jgi:hypothetical protein
MAKFKVTFKEEYMPHEVTRICDVPSEDEIKRVYNLDDDDIEYYIITKL